MEEKNYTVWVGGVEVNDHLLTLEEANALVSEYILAGYQPKVEYVPD